MFRASGGKTQAPLSIFLTRFTALNDHVLQNERDTQYIDLTVVRTLGDLVCFLLSPQSIPATLCRLQSWRQDLYSATKPLEFV